MVNVNAKAIIRSMIAIMINAYASMAMHYCMTTHARVARMVLTQLVLRSIVIAAHITVMLFGTIISIQLSVKILK